MVGLVIFSQALHSYHDKSGSALKSESEEDGEESELSSLRSCLHDNGSAATAKVFHLHFPKVLCLYDGRVRTHGHMYAWPGVGGVTSCNVMAGAVMRVLSEVGRKREKAIIKIPCMSQYWTSINPPASADRSRAVSGIVS